MNNMRIKDEFVLQELIDEYIVVPVGDESDRLHGIIRLNDTGAFLWKLLSQNDKTEDALVNALVDEYRIDIDTAKKDVNDFICVVKEYGCIL